MYKYRLATWNEFQIILKKKKELAERVQRHGFFLIRKHEPGSSSVSYIKYPLYVFNLPEKGETYLTSLLSGLNFFLKSSL